MKRQINRVWDEAERQKHGQQVRNRFARDRAEKISLAKAAIDELIEYGITVSQNEVARKTGISVGFVNKHLRGEVEQARQRQRQMSRKPRTTASLSSLEKKNEHLKASNNRLQQELDKHRQINKELLAQVAQIIDLEDEVELLRSQNRELLAVWNANQKKVVNLPTENQTTQNSGTRREHFSVQIKTELEALGIKLTSTLCKTMEAAHEETIIQAIEALKAALEINVIRSPGGWLKKAIEGSWSQNKKLQEKKMNPYPEGFVEWYEQAVKTNYVLDIPIEHLNLDERNEPKVKINQPGIFGAPYRDLSWREAKIEMLNFVN